jgi:hypothetical protein
VDRGCHVGGVGADVVAVNGERRRGVFGWHFDSGGCF